MPCTTGRAFQNLCSTSTCPPINCCRLSTAFSCQPLCPCPILVDSINVDASAEYCAAFKNDAENIIVALLSSPPPEIGSSIDLLSDAFQIVPNLHCNITITIYNIDRSCIAITLTVQNKVITSLTIDEDCSVSSGVSIDINGKFCTSDT